MNYELGGRERLRYELWPECSRQETDAGAAKRKKKKKPDHSCRLLYIRMSQWCDNEDVNINPQVIRISGTALLIVVET